MNSIDAFTLRIGRVTDIMNNTSEQQKRDIILYLCGCFDDDQVFEKAFDAAVLGAYDVRP